MSSTTGSILSILQNRSPLSPARSTYSFDVPVTPRAPSPISVESSVEEVIDVDTELARNTDEKNALFLEASQRPISPSSTLNLLTAHAEDVSPTILAGYARQVANMAVNRAKGHEEHVRFVKSRHTDVVQHLERELQAAKGRADGLQDRLDASPCPSPDELEAKCPVGFVANRDRCPDFFIPFDSRSIRTPFVQSRDDGTVLGTIGRPEDPLFVHHLYADPQLTSDDYLQRHIEPLQPWLLRQLQYESDTFPLLIEEAKGLDDWGLLADLTRYNAIDGRLQRTLHGIQRLKDEEDGLLHDLRSCRFRLERARAPERLASLRALEDTADRFLSDKGIEFDPTNPIRPVRLSARQKQKQKDRGRSTV